MSAQAQPKQKPTGLEHQWAATQGDRPSLGLTVIPYVLRVSCRHHCQAFNLRAREVWCFMTVAA